LLHDDGTAELQARLESQLDKMAEAAAAVERARANRADIELPEELMPRPDDHDLADDE
jgi:hypothetical protein